MRLFVEDISHVDGFDENAYFYYEFEDDCLGDLVRLTKYFTKYFKYQYYKIYFKLDGIDLTLLEDENFSKELPKPALIQIQMYDTELTYDLVKLTETQYKLLEKIADEFLYCDEQLVVKWIDEKDYRRI